VSDLVAFLLSLTAVEALWVPAALAAGAVGLAPPMRRLEPSGPACAIGIWVGFLLVRPLPVLPPIGGLGWLPFAVLAGLALGIAADRPRWRLVAGLAFVIPLPVAISVLVGENAYASIHTMPSWLVYALLGAAGMLAMGRLAGQAASPRAPVLIALAAGGLAALGWVYGTRLGLHGATIAAAVAGAGLAAYLLNCAWSRGASFAAGAGHLTLAASMAYWHDAFVLPVTASFLVYYAPDVAAAMPGREIAGRARLEAAIAAGFAALAPLVYLYGG